MNAINRTFIAASLALALGAMAAGLPSAAVAGEGADLFDDCKVCHIVKLNELKRKKGPTLIEAEDATRAPTGEQNEASTKAMCMSCHDGFVADSRAMWKKGHMGHRVGMAPSAKIQPAMYDDEPVFPLNDDGVVYCGSCHSGHAGEGEAENAPIFLRANPADGNICQGCHADKGSIVGSPHVRRAGKKPDYQKGGTCSKCHVPHMAEGPALFARTPGPANVPISTTCRSCHEGDPEPGEHPATVVAWSQDVRQGYRPDSSTEMPVFDAEGKHARTGVIGCPTCHDPHVHRAEGRPEHLEGKYLRLATPEHLLCADCHGEQSIVKYMFFHSPVSR